jgi:hypothetical protein
MCLNHNKNQFFVGWILQIHPTINPASQKRTVFTPRNFFKTPSRRVDIAKKLRIQLKIQSVRLKRKLDAGFIAQAPSGPIQKIAYWWNAQCFVSKVVFDGESVRFTPKKLI